MSISKFSFGSLLLLGMLLAHSIVAQTFRGGINGSVVDPSGAVVANAAITATDIATGLDYKTGSTGNGQFVFQDWPLANYQIKVTATGFPAFNVTKIPVTAGAIYTFPVKLALAHTTTTVETELSAICHGMHSMVPGTAPWIFLSSRIPISPSAYQRSSEWSFSTSSIAQISPLQTSTPWTRALAGVPRDSDRYEIPSATSTARLESAKENHSTHS